VVREDPDVIAPEEFKSISAKCKVSEPPDIVSVLESAIARVPVPSPEPDVSSSLEMMVAAPAVTLWFNVTPAEARTVMPLLNTEAVLSKDTAVDDFVAINVTRPVFAVLDDVTAVTVMLELTVDPTVKPLQVILVNSAMLIDIFFDAPIPIVEASAGAMVKVPVPASRDPFKTKSRAVILMLLFDVATRAIAATVNVPLPLASLSAFIVSTPAAA
jgi:hypothetical protein